MTSSCISVCVTCCDPSSLHFLFAPGTHSKGLIWLKNEAGQHFPNHLIRKGTKSILLYAHGNGGSLGDFKSITFFYAQWYDSSHLMHFVHYVHLS